MFWMGTWLRIVLKCCNSLIKGEFHGMFIFSTHNIKYLKWTRWILVFTRWLLELKGIRSVTNNETKCGGKQLWHQHMRVSRGKITELKARLKKQNGEWNKYPKRLYENQIDSDMKRRAKRIRIVIWPSQEILHETNWK